MALSSDGKTVAIGAPQSSEFGTGTGVIRVFQFDDASGDARWELQGSGLGSEVGSAYGSAVALSSNGRRVTGGAPTTPYVKSIARAGAVFVFDREQEDAVGQQ